MIGLITLALSGTGFIVFLVLSGSNCEHQRSAVVVNDTIEISILIIMIIVSTWVSLFLSNA